MSTVLVTGIELVLALVWLCILVASDFNAFVLCAGILAVLMLNSPTPTRA